MVLKLTAICITYKRPLALEHAIESFLKQDYPNKAMIILDDAGQYRNMEGDGWKLVTSPVRYRTIGEKRNASAALAPQDTDVYCVWDDDDIYLPWHMSGIAKAMEHGNFAIPTKCYVKDNHRPISLVPTGRRYHAAWGFTRELFESVRGYPFVQSGQDLDFRDLAFRNGGAVEVDPLSLGFEPSFIMRWCQAHSLHLSAFGRGQDGYEKLGRGDFYEVHQLIPQWDRDWVKEVQNV